MREIWGTADCSGSQLWWELQDSVHVLANTHRNVYHPPAPRKCLLYDRKQNKTSGPSVRVFYPSPFTKMQNVHFSLLQPNLSQLIHSSIRLLHSRHWEPSLDGMLCLLLGTPG